MSKCVFLDTQSDRTSLNRIEMANKSEEDIPLAVKKRKILRPLFDCTSEIVKYKCSKCGQENHFLGSLQLHSQQGHTQLLDKNPLYKCSNCLFNTFSKYIYTRHILFECKKKNDPNEKCTSKNDFVSHRLRQKSIPLRCQQCSFSTFQESILRKHIDKKHKTIKIPKYFCEWCSFQTNYKSDWLRHLSKPEHCANLRGQKKFQCQYCPSKFKVAEHLNDHVKWIHAPPGTEEWKKSARCQVQSDESQNSDLTPSQV